MRIVYLDSTVEDFLWIRRYYEETFVAGAAAFSDAFEATAQLLRDFPMAGTPHPTREGVRIRRIVNTPFAYVYRIQGDIIRVEHILDQRAAS